MYTNGLERKKNDPLAALDDGGALAKLMRAFYETLVEAAWGDSAADGVDVVFSLANPFVQDVLDRLAKDVKGIAETTRSDIQMLIGQQAGNGWSMEELQQAIIDQGVTQSASRALLIARTESASAYSQGSIAAYKASGVVSGVKWLASGDSCAICQALDGQVRGLDEAFGDGIDSVPAHPNCTCSLSPIVSKD